jgi:hypothetical protein
MVHLAEEDKYRVLFSSFISILVRWHLRYEL